MQQITFLTNDQLAEQLGDWLTELGAVAVTFMDAGDHPIFEPDYDTLPLWEQTYTVGLFTAEIDLSQLLVQLKALGQLEQLPQYRIEQLPDKDWERACMEDFHPMQFGHKLWICPSWCDIPDPNGVNILLDPGLAFGTGTHPTTALCLEWLATHRVNNKTVIDYGCGSGILAIAAVKLGAKQTWAVDIHPQALEATKENAEKNQISNQLHIMHPDALPTMNIDILIANILAAPLLKLAPEFAKTLKPQGQLLLSGILTSQADTIIQRYQTWFDLAPPIINQDWCLITGVRQS